jgi:CheY-like chemotaxis protein
MMTKTDDPEGARAVLIVEDEWLIAEAISGELVQAGYVVVGPASSPARAIKLIEETEVQAAILDLSLNGEKSYAVADALAARGVPFAFLTGYNRQEIAPGYDERPCLSKPLCAETLRTAIADLLNS